MSKLDKSGSERGKRRGMSRAEEHADREWWSYTYALVTEVAKRQPYLFADDIEALRLKRGGPETHEARAMGPLMLQCKRDHVCDPTNRWVPSSQLANHRRPMRIWKSRLYQE